MSGFLDYLEEFDKKEEKIVKESRPSELNSEGKSKVLSLNVEVRSPEGANIVIEKLQSWVSENFGSVDKPKQKPKKPYRIIPKKVNKSPVVETRSHAVNILDGLPGEPVVTEQNQTNINNIVQQQKPQFNLDSVKGHASALL